MEVYRKINLQNSTMMDQYQEKKRAEDRNVLIEASSRVRDLQAQRRNMEQMANDPTRLADTYRNKQSILVPEPAWLDNNETDIMSQHAVHNGGHIHVDNDQSLALYQGNDLKQAFLKEEWKIRKKENLNSSVRIIKDTKGEGKRDLLQYRIFENDSDGDVFEGLGNTTLDIKGNIAAGISSDEEESKGTDNIQN